VVFTKEPLAKGKRKESSTTGRKKKGRGRCPVESKHRFEKGQSRFEKRGPCPKTKKKEERQEQIWNTHIRRKGKEKRKERNGRERTRKQVYNQKKNDSFNEEDAPWGVPKILTGEKKKKKRHGGERGGRYREKRRVKMNFGKSKTRKKRNY